MPKKGKKTTEKTAGAEEEEDDDDYPELDIRPERWVNLRVGSVTHSFLRECVSRRRL